MAKQHDKVQEMDEAVRELVKRNQDKMNSSTTTPKERQEAEEAIRRGKRFLNQTQSR
jgi:hypothetical protein